MRISDWSSDVCSSDLQRDALLAHRFPHLFGHEGRRRLLDHLLVAALDAAFALVEVEDVAVLVSEDLDLDMARIEDEFLDEDAVVAEAVEPFALGRLKALADVLFLIGEADRKSTRLNSRQ